jgi:hypothetical protein
MVSQYSDTNKSLTEMHFRFGARTHVINLSDVLVGPERWRVRPANMLRGLGGLLSGQDFPKEGITLHLLSQRRGFHAILEHTLKE